MQADPQNFLNTTEPAGWSGKVRSILPEGSGGGDRAAPVVHA
jgi:hypothetical protein